MLRHSVNSNLRLWYGGYYGWLPIQADKAPFVESYLMRLDYTIQRAVRQYSRVFAFRVDLRLPVDRPVFGWPAESSVMSRFFQSLKAKISHNRKLVGSQRRYFHDTQVRYVWVCEYGLSDVPHFHLVILLNYDAFNTLGDFKSEGVNTFVRLEEAWASALGVERKDVKGLVEIPKNPSYQLRRDDLSSVAAFFYRASYLCKAATKCYGISRHAFGSSRI